MNRRQVLGLMGAAGAGLMMTPTQAQAHPGHDHAGYNPLAAGYDANKGEYVLPDLPYAYDALEPSIDAQTMELHHTRHHAAYVNNLNGALAKLAEARTAGDFASVQALSKSIAFNGGGHTLHTLFWTNMAPAGNGGGGDPPRVLRAKIDAEFGSLAAFRDHFNAAATSVEGGGWGIVGHDKMSDKLIIFQAENQQKLTTWAATPVLVLDVWEHAYYLKYQNRRGDYVKAFWDVVNWAEVAKRVGL